MNKRFEHILQNSWLELALRWTLGATFLYASYSKIASPAEFAKIIYGYGLFPPVLINLVAIIVPFLELVIALALILGIYPRSAALVVNGLLMAFIISISINLIRGHEFDCGCFAFRNSGSRISTSSTILRDMILLALGIQVFFYRHVRRWCVRQGE